MRTLRVPRAIGVFGLVMVVGASFAQPDGRQGRGPGGSPEEFVDRIFSQMDSDENGEISKAEAEGKPLEHAFVEIDTDGNGTVTRVEMVAWLQKRAASERGGQVEDFEGGMRMAGRAMRGLRRSALDASTREDDLKSIAAIEAGLLGAKAHLSEVEMAPQAKERFGDDHAGFEIGLRMGLLAALSDAIDLERAITESRSDDARAGRDRIVQAMKRGHDLFQPEEDE